MDNAWKDKLRERFSDYSVPEPDGLWEGIEQGMAGKPRRKVIPVWWLTGGIAAAAAAAVALVILLPPSMEKQAPVEPVSVLADAREAEPLTPETASEDLREPETHVVQAVRPASSKGSVPSVRRPLLAENITETVSAEPETYPALSIVAEDVPETVPEVIPETVPETVPEAVSEAVSEFVPDFPESVFEEERSKNAFSFGVFHEGGQGAGEASQGYGMTNTADYLTRVMNDGSTSDGPGLVRMLSANRASTFEAHHKAPVRVGVTFSWSFLPWLSLSTGLNWTTLSSDLIESTAGTRSVTRQDLGYLGVPLRLEAGTHPWKGFRVYAGAGGMAETCFLAKASTDTYIGNHLEGTVDSVPAAGGLLWSVGALAGAEYRISPHVGVYLAPGLEYHFDNGSGVRSAYTEKPLHWNVSLGVRFEFGK